MKSWKFSSLEDLKNEIQIKQDLLPSAKEKFEEKKYQIFSAKIAEIRRSKKYGTTCIKHGPLQSECARLGIQRTKTKRSEYSDNSIFSESSNEKYLNKLEELYADARKRFHQQPCTCAN